MVYCTKCGMENEDQSVYCAECGLKLQDDSETLQEMIHVAWNKGTVPPRKILCFTDKNAYIMEGNFLIGLGWGIGGIVGNYIEKKDTSQKEENARNANFQEVVAQDPEVVVIPYNEIMKVTMGKKRMLLNPSITIETTTDDYKFTVMDGKKYKQYQKSIPSILGDRVQVE